MSNLDDVRRLKEEIIASFDERMSTIMNVVRSTSEMATSTREMTNRFRQEHQAMRDDLRMKLQDVRKKLSDDEIQRRQDSQTEFKQRTDKLTEVLGAFRHNGDGQFAKSVNEMLNLFRTTRLEDFNNFIQDLQQRVATIKNGVLDFQADFRQSHQEMQLNQKEALTEFNSGLKNFRKEMVAQEKDRFNQARVEIQERTGYLEKMFREVSNMVSAFRNDHAQMTDILKKMIDFKGFNKERLHDFNSMMGQIRTNQKQREQDTANLLEDFNSAHKQMSQDLGEMLSNLKANLKETDQERRDLAHQDMQQRLNYLHQLKSEISGMLTSLREESREVMREWSELSRILEQKMQVEVPAKPEKTPKAKPEAHEKPVTPPPKAIFKSEESSEEDTGKILSIINAHSDGIRLVEISNEMSKKWQTLIPQIKSLLESGKIEKQNNLYFPV